MPNNPCTFTSCPVNTRCIADDGSARCVPDLNIDTICAGVVCNPDQKCAIILDGKARCEQACSSDRDCQFKQLGLVCDTLIGICKQETVRLF